MELNLSMYLTNAISFENVDPSFPFPIIDQLINQKLQIIFFSRYRSAGACVRNIINKVYMFCGKSFEISRKRILENGRLG